MKYPITAIYTQELICRNDRAIQKYPALKLLPFDIDHSGLIPKLAKEGFKGKIYYTRPTGELAEILLHDSAEIQTYESDYINKKVRRNTRSLRGHCIIKMMW